MDQQAFRQLLNSQRTGDSNGASSSEGRAFGLNRKRKADYHLSPGSSSQSIDLAPRSVAAQKQKPSPHTGDKSIASSQHRPRPPSKNKGTNDAYIDRAEARRIGRGNEFTEVERLLEDFQKRKEGASEEEKKLLDEQMKFLGGDEKHSILVKGLDYALLAQNRAKTGASQSNSVDDKDLEDAYTAGSSLTVADAPVQHDSDIATADQRRTRDSVIEALKRRRGVASSDTKSNAISEDFERAKQAGKFKPISTSQRSGFAPVGGIDSSPDVIYKNGKRMRKKKKAGDDSNATSSDIRPDSSSGAVNHSKEKLPLPKRQRDDSYIHQEGLTSGESGNNADKRSTGHVQVSERDNMNHGAIDSAKASSTASKAGDGMSQVSNTSAHRSGTPSQAQNFSTSVNEFDDDGDIFDGAGRWEGIDVDDNSDENNDTVRDTTPPPYSTSEREQETSSGKGPVAAQTRDWFASTSNEKLNNDSDVQENDDRAYEVLPESVRRMIQPGRPSVAAEAPSSEASHHIRTTPPPSSQARLEGLSTSALPSDVGRLLLEREEEKARHAEQKKSRDKKGNKSKSSLSQNKDDD